MTRRKHQHPDPAARAIARVRSIRDEIEQAQRVPGDRLEITRQVSDVIVDNCGVIARAILALAEREP